MSTNGFDMNRHGVDARLPPRKRLLAEMKRQTCSESNSSSSVSVSLSAPSIDNSPLSEFDVRLSNLLRSYKNGSNMSPEEIAVAAKSAAEAAAKAAEVARAAAEEKAAIAAKAIAAVKSALDMVEYEETSNMYRTKDTVKKHAPVKIVYNECQPFAKCGDDEELARRLHRAINSSPRISNNFPSSKGNNHKHKKVKVHSPNDNSGITDGTSMREGSNEAESRYPNEKSFEGSDASCINGRITKRGKIEQKKMSLSICSSKDQANSKEELNLTNSLLPRARIDSPIIRELSLFSEEPSVDNPTM